MDEGTDHFPVADQIDHEILMHRDAHFGGLFSVMLDYYREEKKGVQPDFSIERIERLEQLEVAMKQNLAPLLLTGPEAEKIGEAKTAYKKLRAIYELESAKSQIPKLIADLILAETEEAEEEIKAVVAEKNLVVKPLIDLLRNENFYDPLFPGYGQAPVLAAECLGLLSENDKRAIISLFEAIGQLDFFADDKMIHALKLIGEPAKAFLLKVLHGHPITEDNEKAAIALLEFQDAEVAQAALNLLKEKEVQNDLSLSTYLVLACEFLPMNQWEEFIELVKQPSFPKHLELDAKRIAKLFSK